MGVQSAFNRLLGVTAHFTSMSNISSSIKEAAGNKVEGKSQSTAITPTQQSTGNQHMQQVGQQQVQQQINFKEYLDSLSTAERADVLKYGQHVQSVAKRGGE